MNLIDCHSHSDCSFDAHNTVREMCDKANEQNLYAFAITDHYESYLNDERNNVSLILNSISQIEAYKKLATKTKILKGVEIGQPLLDIKSVENLLSLCEFDFTIGSIHNATNQEDFFYIDYQNTTPIEMKKILEQYFIDIYNMCVWNKIDILAHLSYPYRYIKNSHRKDLLIDISTFDDIIKQSFKVIIKNGKGLEINSSGLFQEINETMPNEKYLRLYKELGGEIISTGSDSHCLQHLGRGVLQSTELAKKIGFKYLTYFENQKPIMISIN